MATTSNTTKAKPDNPNLTRTKSLGSRKPKLPSSTGSLEDGTSDQKPEKPVPNYLKPTISSRPDAVKFLKKNNSTLDDNQKLLRRRSFDRPPSSLTPPSTSAAPRIQKSNNVSPSRSRDRPAVPREKPITGLRSSSFHGSRSVPKGGNTVKSPHVAPKKSSLSSTSTSLKGKKESSENVTIKKASDNKETTLDSASLSSAQEDGQEEILKVESDVQVGDHEIEETKDENENKEVQVEVLQAEESSEDTNETCGSTTVASTAEHAVIKEADIYLINEDKTEEKLEETKEQEKIKGDDEKEEVKKNIDEDDSQKKVDIDVKEIESVEETTKENEVKEEEKIEKVEEEEKEKVKEEEKEMEKVNEEEKETVKEEDKEIEKVHEEENVKEEVKEKEKVKEEEKIKVEESEEGKKREVMKGKKESPSAYNDVIASKMQENPRKNKVLALAGAFQTVIDYETAASK